MVNKIISYKTFLHKFNSMEYFNDIIYERIIISLTKLNFVEVPENIDYKIKQGYSLSELQLKILLYKCSTY